MKLFLRRTHVKNIIKSLTICGLNHVMGVEWFVFRRGTPAIIWSDTVTKFVGAKKELREKFEKCRIINIAAEPALEVIKWSLNPSWERLVFSFKRIIYTILGTRRVTDEFLNTIFCLLENALNARLLTAVSTDPSNQSAVTPDHFLIGNQAKSNSFNSWRQQFQSL